MTAFGVTSKVIGSLVHLLQKRRFRVNQTRRLQNPMYLGYDFLRLQNMLQNRLRYDAVNASILQWNAVAIGDKLYRR